MKSFRTAGLWSVAFSILGGLVVGSPAWPADLTIPNTFVSGTPATAADVNANFGATATSVNSKQDRVTGTCPTGQSIRTINQNGTVVCQPLSFFGGDGSAGDLTVGTQNWSTTPPVNPNFANITINAGQTLTVPAGTTIRCSGTFTNDGTLSVLTGAASDGAFGGLSITGAPPQYITAIPHPGDTPGAASIGQADNNGSGVPHFLNGGPGGKAIPRAVAQTSFGKFRIGGGAGGAYDAQGGQGGGLVKIYCEGAIINTGSILAQGASGSNQSIGGGGGGIVVLASRTLVTNSGTIDVSGGNGNGGGGFGGNGGGGGGGIILMVSPAPVLGTVFVGGGTGATGAGTITAAGRIAGGGGGGSGGAGGSGGNVTAAASGVPSNAGDGVAGYAITMTLDPITIAH